jgi:FkbM family methyltransferase
MKFIFIRVKNYLSKLRVVFFPTIREKEVKRYFTDGGDERFRYDFDLNSESIVFDLGGYKGQWASDIYSRYNCYISVFEPVKGFCEKITDRFKFNNKIKTYALALSKENRNDTIAMSDDGSSLFKENSQVELINFEDVSDFFNKNKVNKIDLMKINIEGGEYDLLDRLIETNLINKISFLHIQFHDFVPDADDRMEKIKNNLSHTHSLELEYKYVWENWKIKAI